MEQWISKIPNFHATYILFYIGINDLFVDYTTKDLPLTHYDSIQKVSFSHYFKRSLFIYILRRIRFTLKAKINQVPHRKINFNELKTTQTYHPEYVDTIKMLRSPYTQLYYNRVIKLASLTKQLGATPIFVSQRSFKYFLKDSILYGFDSLFTKNNLQLNGLDYYYLEENLNQTTMKACQDANAICIDFGQYQSFNSHDFYDWVHTTPAAIKKFLRYFMKNSKVT